MSEEDLPLIWEPNRHADQAAIYSVGPIHLVNGYQRYLAAERGGLLIPGHRNLRRKAKVVVPAMRRELERLRDASFADFGCNTGYFLLAAKRHGFAEMHGYDLDEGVRPVFDSPLMADIKYSAVPIQEVEATADVTLSISLFHWLIGQFGDDKDSLSGVVKLLSSRSRHAAIVEVVTSDDPLVVSYGHYKQEITEERFRQTCSDHFDRVERIGESSPTRLIYVLGKG